jgi:hypothetical protein
LLVPGNSLPSAARAEIIRLAPARIVLLGGPGVVGPAVESAANGLAAKVIRVSGADRYGTSAAIVQQLFTHASEAFVASGANFPDALAGGVAAASAGAPLVLTQSSCIPDVVQTQLEQLNITSLVVLGGTASLSPAVASGTSCGVPDWLTAVNAYRAAYGVGSVYDDAQGGGNAAAHIYYMRNTGVFGHSEDPSSPYYTASGALGGESSDLALNGGTGTDLIDGWMAAPFHALALLRPYVAGEAMVSDWPYGALYLSYDWQNTLTPTWPLHWPSASMPDRLLTVSSGEVPSPTSSCPSAYQSKVVGVPLIVSFGPDAGVVT